MRRIAFSHTTKQFLAGQKDVTRRLGWQCLYLGDHLMAIEKGMGLRKGEHQRLLGEIVITDVRRERLDAITESDCVREGFPEMSPAAFVEMFCQGGRCKSDTVITRIQFRRIAALAEKENP